MKARKNAAPYQVNRSAVKKIQLANKGTEREIDTSPAYTNNFGRFRTNNMANTKINPTS